MLRGIEPRFDHGVPGLAVVGLGQAHDIGGVGRALPRRRQREQPQAGALRVRDVGRRELLDAAEQAFEWRHQMRLVQHDERVDAEQPGGIWTHLTRHAIALEQQPRSPVSLA